MAVPAPRTWLAGETVNAGHMNTEINTAITWLISGFPLFRAVQSASQVINNTTWTSLTFATEDIDRDNGHSTSVNTSRYTAQTAGRYRVNGGVTFNFTGTSIVATRLAVNGTAVNGSAQFHGKSNNNFSSARTDDIVYLGIGDYVEVQAWHDAGAAWGTEVSGGDVAPHFRAQWISS
ncbi:hypothetical protein [Crossiella sp. CA198]|uniref:hypothetical protein n=1 Tax=Crossiella sp. CA198 TaxID=3455607 RepID=UPI003F8D88F3